MIQETPGDPRVIVALDFPDAEQAEQLVARLRPGSCRLKIGKELFTRAGPELVRRMAGDGFDVFLDLKFHDIPNTVARACEAAAALDVWMLNVHASGGRKMMEAARTALEESTGRRPLLIAVTVLTSMGADDLRELGLDIEPAEQVSRLAALAKASGLDGVVSSPREAEVLRAQMGPNFKLVTPGVRPTGAALDDQTRVLGPAQAIRSGSDYLVIGRPITRASDPAGTLAAINADIEAALRRWPG